MRTIALCLSTFTLILCLTACGRTQNIADPPATTIANPTAISTQGEIKMEDIWSLTDKTDFVIAMYQHLNEKTQYGEDVSVLSEEERIFYITQTLEMEVNNGGFNQFFFNSGGNFSNELVEAFTAIGAEATAAICQKAIAAYGCEIPTDWFARQDMMEKLASDEIDEIHWECDEAFYAYEDNLDELNYNFVMNHKEQFT